MGLQVVHSSNGIRIQPFIYVCNAEAISTRIKHIAIPIAYKDLCGKLTKKSKWRHSHDT